MSMLSAQIDMLRHEADMLRDHGTFIGYGGLTSTDPEMIECADLMCDAADTIWQLRDDLQRTNAENAKLRELAVLNWEWAHGCCGNNCKMKTEGCGYGIDRECNYEREIWDRMRELGVEVDE